MNSDSNKTVKVFTPLNLKYKLETITPRVRTAFTPITNTSRPQSKKNIFICPDDTFAKNFSKPAKRAALAFQTLFPVRTKTLPLCSPTSELNDITTGNLCNYELGKILGKGAYAEVRLCKNTTDNQKYALKSYDKFKLREPHRRRNLRREVQVMKLLQHENIVKIKEAIKSSKQVHIVQEYFPGFSLGSYLKSRVSKRLPESEAKMVFSRLISALQYMHSMGVAHRDIKLDNILIDSKLNTKFIDFGFSTVNELKSKVFCGTPSYMAAEIVSRKEYSTQAADIWALGVVLFVMLCGAFPFRASCDKDLYAKIAEGIKGVPDVIPVQAKRLILKMMSLNPERRPSAADILNDPWLTEETQNVRHFVKLCRSPSTER